MKGVEESVSQIVFIIGALAAMAFLIILAYNYMPKSFGEDEAIGNYTDRGLALYGIENAAYECWEKNKGRKSAEICRRISLELDEKILESEIRSKIKPSRIPPESLVAEDLGPRSEAAIKYENNRIYIQDR
jgi:hypothetical protein